MLMFSPDSFLMTIALPKLYFENAAGRVFEHPDGYVVFQYLPGERRFPDLQALLAQTRDLLDRQCWHRLLGDQRHMAPFTEEESTWIVNYWLAEARQGPKGLFGALLLAPDLFASLPLPQVTHEARAGALTYRLFDTEEKAARWLEHVG